jgi:uncharacterized membrane protein
MFYKTSNMAASAAAIVGAVLVLGGAGTEFLHREIGGVALFVVAQVTLASAVFLSAILAKVGDRETLSVYKEMRNRA